MAIITNSPDESGFKKDFEYFKPVPTLTSNNVGINSEIAKWILDRNNILYYDKTHGPWKIQSIANKLTGEKEKSNTPVLQMTDAFLYGVESIIMYWEKRCRAADRLLPDEPAKQDEVLDLYHLFSGEFFEGMVTKYMYYMLLSSKKSAAGVLKQGTSSLIFSMRYPSIKKAISKAYNLEANNPDEYIVEIRKVFEKVNELLKDGRKYLTGDQFTLADLGFAACAAPLILPEESGVVLPQIKQVPDRYREHVKELRATVAGQFVFRLYQANRPSMIPQSEIPDEPGFLKKAIGKLLINLKKTQYKLFYSLQKKWPVLKIPFIKVVLVNRNDLLVEMMKRDNDFTVEEINSKNMSDQKGAFYLGMDRNNPQFDRERNFVMKATKREDLDIIRDFVRSSAEKILANSAQYGKIDVANSFCKVILVRLMDHYFGVPSPTEREMMRWLRAQFFDLFLNFFENKEIFETALQASNARKEWLLQLIRERRQQLKEGKKLDDNILNRFIIMQQESGYEWVDDDVLQRNIGGLLTGIFETTNKAAVLILDELFNRPDALKDAINASLDYDVKKMYGFVNEALRFNPVQPGVIRFNETEQFLIDKKQKKYRIRAKSKVFAVTSAAMFDPAAFPDPKKFIADRDAVYMNYGHALHECYGKYINAVTLSEFVSAILRLKNVRREKGITGRGSGINQQSFPNNFVVCFDVTKTEETNFMEILKQENLPA